MTLLQEAARSSRSAASWRKILLLNRAALLRAWPRYFPRHNFSDLRPTLLKLLPPRGWDDHWSAAAREYHEERQQRAG